MVNHTSLDKDGNHLVDIISKDSSVSVKVVFSPEHGFKGNLSAGAFFSDITTPDYKIVSLYGKNKKPSLQDLDGIDIILFDIQDIGSRYYTYISTLTYVMEAAADLKIPLIVLDRPNPLGRKIDGPVLDMEYSSFVGMHPMPIRHGMTVGEIALMINGEKWISSGKTVDLQIIKLQDWDTHPGYFSISPSPNISNFKTALIYNGMCLLEGTNISEGRGTRDPFLLFGAPWMNSKKILKDLINLKFSGVNFYQKTFKPISIEGAKYPKYENELSEVKADNKKLAMQVEDKINNMRKSGM